jgi:hypothetical protein
VPPRVQQRAGDLRRNRRSSQVTGIVGGGVEWVATSYVGTQPCLVLASAAPALVVASQAGAACERRPRNISKPGALSPPSSLSTFTNSPENYPPEIAVRINPRRTANSKEVADTSHPAETAQPGTVRLTSPGDLGCDPSLAEPDTRSKSWSEASRQATAD